MAIHSFNLKVVHPSWLSCLQNGLRGIDPDYLQQLSNDTAWLPGPDKIFNAFTLPVSEVNYVLFGESPYPRAESANGFAFWDDAVHELWSEQGLSTKVNRATSLRNIIKMLLIAENCLKPDNCTQQAISQINKSNFVTTNQELFANFLRHGFLLLNATPVLNGSPQIDARQWLPLTAELLKFLCQERPNVKLILFGRIANTIDQLLEDKTIDKLYAEHPYNLSFITNKNVLNFFRPLHLLRKVDSTKHKAPQIPQFSLFEPHY